MVRHIFLVMPKLFLVSYLKRVITLIRHILYMSSSVSTNGFDHLTIDMTEINEPATATHPINWRIIQEVFPETDGEGDVMSCTCKKGTN